MHEKAEEYELKAYHLRKKIHGETSLEASCSLNSLGCLAQEAGNWDKAIEFLQESMNIREKLSQNAGKATKEYVDSLNNLAIIMIMKKEFKEAESLKLKSLVSCEQIYGKCR